METLNTDGVTLVGEVVSRTMREAVAEPDFSNVKIAGKDEAYHEVLVRAQSLIAAAGPYDDTRALKDMIVWLADRIRMIHEPHATDGTPDG